MAAAVFEPIPSRDVPSLMSVLKANMPRSTVALHWLRVQSEWVERIAGLRLRVLCPGGNCKTGDVLALVHGLLDGDRWSAIFYLNSDCDVTSALANSPHIPWSHIAHFSGVHVSHAMSLLNTLAARGMPQPHVMTSHVYHMSSEQAEHLPQIDLDPNISVSCLNSSHVDTICATWPHFSEPLRNLVVDMVTQNLSCGVFYKEQLVASVVHTYYGGLGLLQTLPDFRGRGLASLAVTQLSRDLGKKGVSPHLHIMQGSDAAQGLVRRLGFSKMQDSFARIVMDIPSR